MPERFDELIQTVMRDRVEQHHEALPADFGPFDGRLTMFIRCLEVLANRYPGVKITVSGERQALLDLGLVPGGEFLVGRRAYKAHLTPPGAQRGVIRVSFSPA